MLPVLADVLLERPVRRQGNRWSKQSSSIRRCIDPSIHRTSIRPISTLTLSRRQSGPFMMQLVRVEEDFSRAGFHRQFVKGQDFIRFVIRIFPSTCGSENSDVPMQRAACMHAHFPTSLSLVSFSSFHSIPRTAARAARLKSWTIHSRTTANGHVYVRFPFRVSVRSAQTAPRMRTSTD